MRLAVALVVLLSAACGGEDPPSSCTDARDEPSDAGMPDACVCYAEPAPGVIVCVPCGEPLVSVWCYGWRSTSDDVSPLVPWAQPGSMGTFVISGATAVYEGGATMPAAWTSETSMALGEIETDGVTSRGVIDEQLTRAVIEATSGADASRWVATCVPL